MKNQIIEKVALEDYNNPLVKIEINEDLRRKINEFTKHLLRSNYPYDALCWALAEFQLIFEEGNKKYSEHEVIERQNKIFNTSLEYEELCWFIASFKIYLEEAKLYP